MQAKLDRLERKKYATTIEKYKEYRKFIFVENIQMVFVCMGLDIVLKNKQISNPNKILRIGKMLDSELSIADNQIKEILLLINVIEDNYQRIDLAASV